MGAQNKVKNAFRAGFENRCLRLLDISVLTVPPISVY